MKTIALLTDFGTSDWYAGAVRGTILSICPEARIADITHEIPSGNIQAGAFALMCAYPHFPKGTVFLAVVDPGVGGGRLPIAVETEDYRFVAPDNGLLSFCLNKQKCVERRIIQNDLYTGAEISATFHGRDIFAPAAAHLANGIPTAVLGEKVNRLQQLTWPKPVATPRDVSGQVMHIDGFGNAITSLCEKDIQHRGPLSVRAGRQSFSLLKTYSEAPSQQPLALVGSSGFLELSINNGDASGVLDLRVGDTVTVSY